MRSVPITPTAKSFNVVGNIDTDAIIKLQSNIVIPDGEEITWPLFVSDSKTIRDVRVTLRGLYHEYAGDLMAKLVHNDKEAVMFANSCG